MAAKRPTGYLVLVVYLVLLSHQGHHARAQLYSSGTIQQALFNYMRQMSQTPTTQAPPVQPPPTTNQVTPAPPTVTQAPMTPSNNVVPPPTPAPTQAPVQTNPPPPVMTQTTPAPLDLFQPLPPLQPVQPAQPTIPPYSEIFLPVVTVPPPTTTPKPPPKPGSIPFVPPEWYTTRRPTYPPTTPPPTVPWTYVPPSPRRESVSPLDVAKTYIPPQFLKSAMNVGRRMGITGYFENHGCVDPTTHMPPGETTQGLVFGCAAPQSKQLCRVVSRQAMGEAAAAGGGSQMQILSMFQPQLKGKMEKCLSPTIMNKLMMQQLTGQGGAGGTNPLMTMMMLGGGGGGGGGANPLMPMLLMNMMNRGRTRSAGQQRTSGLQPRLYTDGQLSSTQTQRTGGSNLQTLGSLFSMLGSAQSSGTQNLASLFSSAVPAQSSRPQTLASLFSSAGPAQSSGTQTLASLFSSAGPAQPSGSQSLTSSQPVQSSGSQTQNQTNSASSIYSSMFGSQQSSGTTRAKREARKRSRVKRQTAGNWFASILSGAGRRGQPLLGSPAMPIGAAQSTPQSQNQLGSFTNSLFGMNTGGQTSNSVSSPNTGGQMPSSFLPFGAAQPTSSSGTSQSGGLASLFQSNTAGSRQSMTLPAGAAKPTGQSASAKQGQSTKAQDVLTECMAFLPMMMPAEGGFGSPEAAEHIMDMRKQMLPYECTEAGVLPFRMCCPGQVGRPSMMDLMMSGRNQGA